MLLYLTEKGKHAKAEILIHLLHWRKLLDVHFQQRKHSLELRVHDPDWRRGKRLHEYHYEEASSTYRSTGPKGPGHGKAAETGALLFGPERGKSQGTKPEDQVPRADLRNRIRPRHGRKYLPANFLPQELLPVQKNYLTRSIFTYTTLLAQAD